MEGESLRDRLKREKRLPVGEVVQTPSAASMSTVLERRFLGLAWPLLACGACGSEASGPGVTVTDSAGVTIVTSRDSSHRYATIADSPVARLSEEGVPDREFFRVTGAFAYRDGATVIANAGTGELRIFSPDGALVLSVGGEGEGPGEFGFLGGLFPFAADSLAATDSRLLRVSVFNRHGTFGRDVPFMPAGNLAAPDGVCMPPALQAVLERGGQVYFGWTCIRRDGHGGFLPYEADLLLWDPTTARITVMDRVPVLEAYAPPGPDGRNFDVEFPPFMKVTAVTARGSNVYVATGFEYEVRRYDGAARVIALFRLARAARPTSPELRSAYTLTLPEGSDPRSIHFPRTLPTFDRLMIDDGHRVWAREYVAPGVTEEHWAVFEANGEFAGWVDAPARVSLRAVAGSRVIGIAKDEFEVERPVILQMAREG